MASVLPGTERLEDHHFWLILLCKLFSAPAEYLFLELWWIDALKLRHCTAHRIILCIFVCLLQLALHTRCSLCIIPELHCGLYILITRENKMRLLLL